MPNANAINLSGPQSANGLLDCYELMSIPHFQRGLVWDASSVAALLESLYFETPCGSIILWEPPTSSELGNPLGKKPQFVIIDGQQRIRSLHGVFGGSNDESVAGGADVAGETHEGSVDEAADIGEADRSGVWCLNLGRLPVFEQFFEGGKRFRLFVFAKDPRTPREDGKAVYGAPIQDREALLPVRWFLDREDKDIRRLVEGKADKAIAKAATAVLDNADVRRRLRALRTLPVFQVSVLGSDRSQTDVVGIYNRINSAGKRVESEEKAFANLVAEFTGASRSLKQFFDAVHPDPLSKTPSISGSLDRDDLLIRQKENRFGFKLFMRVFVITLAYHTDRTIGSSVFSFDSASPEMLRKARIHLPAILTTTVKVLQDAADIIRRALYCDDLRMLPETASLWPLFQLLIRFPGLTEAPDRLVSISMRLLLAEMTKAEILKLSKEVNNAQSTKDALACFDDNRRLTAKAVQKAIRVGVGGARSLTNRYALFLYWVLRQNGAREFLYNVNKVRDLAALNVRYKLKTELSEPLEPQKQHIVPYDRLKVLFKLEGRGRPGRHEAHDIGNITYISAGLNSFRIGIGSDPLNLREEPSQNLKAHLLWDPADELMESYSGACQEEKIRKAKYHYDQFCESRRKLIADRLVAWERELRTEGMLEPIPNTAPARMLLANRDDDRVRGLNYPEPVTRAVLQLCALEGTSAGRVRDGFVTIEFARRTPASDRRQLMRLDLEEGGNGLDLKLVNREFNHGFTDAFPEVTVTPKKNATICRLDASELITVQVLNWLTGRLQG